MSEIKNPEIETLNSFTAIYYTKNIKLNFSIYELIKSSVPQEWEPCTRFDTNRIVIVFDASYKIAEEIYEIDIYNNIACIHVLKKFNDQTINLIVKFLETSIKLLGLDDDIINNVGFKAFLYKSSQLYRPHITKTKLSKKLNYPFEEHYLKFKRVNNEFVTDERYGVFVQVTNVPFKPVSYTHLTLPTIYSV